MNLEIYIVKLATLARIIELDNVIQGNSTCKLQAFINIGYFEKKVHPRTYKLSPSQIAFRTAPKILFWNRTPRGLGTPGWEPLI